MANAAYNTSIRQALNKQGINNGQIGYKNGYVTVNGNNFMKADKNYNGAAFTNQQNFSNAWNSYSQASQPKATTPTYTAPKVPTAPAGSVAIRSGLQSAGYDPSSIGYNKSTNTVTLNNNPFMVPSANVQGTTYANQNAFNSALGNYRINDLTNQVANNTKLPENRYTPKIDDTIKQLMDFAKTQQQVDPYGTAQYAAYQAQSDRRANQGIRSAQEAMGSSGFGRSTALGERAQGIQNQETEYLETQVVPQIIAAEQAKQQQQYDNLFNVLNPLMSQQGYSDNRAQTELGNVYNALGALTSEQQRGYDNARADAALTGNYMTPEAQEAINVLLGLKQQAETKGISKEQRTALSKQADGVRNQLSMMGIDPTQFGSNVNYKTASTVNPGRTLQGQQLDMQKQAANWTAAQNVWDATGRLVTPQSDWSGLIRQSQDGNVPLTQAAQQQQFNNNLTNEQFAYQKARDGIGDVQWKAKFDEDVRQFGLSYGLQQLSEQNQAAYQQAQISMGQDDNARLWAQLDAEMSKSANSAPEYNGMTPNQVYDAVKNRFTKTDKAGKEYVPNDAGTKQKIYEAVGQMGLPQGQDEQVMMMLGMSAADIKKYDKQYGVDSGN